MSKLENVFGVGTKGIIESFVERQEVDGFFQSALKSDKQIIVYGSSKQGKSSLIRKHLTDPKINITCAPNTERRDIYATVLRQMAIELPIESTESKTTTGEDGGAFRVRFCLPVVAGIEGEISSKDKTDSSELKRYKNIEYNLNLAHDIAEILHLIKFDRTIVLDNFHYLQEEVQKQLAFDLRIFQEEGIRFIILGIWRKRNRLSQFNGDIQDRIIEIPVEPWEKSDLEKVIKKGSEILNVDFSEVSDELIESSFDSIGVLQELLNASCMAAGVTETMPETVKITRRHMEAARKRKLQDYSSRHLHALETFAEPVRRTRGNLVPLFIPYYFLKVLIRSDFSTIAKGFKRKQLHEEIAKIHHRPNDLRSSDMSNFLYNITKYQIDKNISPPLFDYDQSINTLNIIDSTLYFFLKNCDKEEVLEVIAPPSVELQEREDKYDVDSQLSPPHDGV